MTSTIGVAAIILASVLELEALAIRRQAPSTRSTGVVLLYDNSNSQNLVLYGVASINVRLGVPRTRDLVIGAIAANLDASTEIRVASFGNRVLVSPAWVRSRVDIERAFDAVTQDGGPSPIWDGLYEAVGVLETVSQPRAILLVSDGKASANVRGFAQALERAERSGVTVHVVATGVMSRKTATAVGAGDPTERLKRLAAATGGTYGEPEPVDLPQYFGRLFKTLNQSR